MREDTVTTTVYKFNELSDDVKQKVIDNYREHNLDYEWWDFVYEDVKTIAALFGLDIDKIYFSGFANQGDGACFEGDYSYKKGSLRAVKEHAPLDTRLHGIVAQLQSIQKPAFYRLQATTKHSGHYYHSGCMSVDVTNYTPDGQWDCLTDEQNTDITDELRCFADWIYTKLEQEHDHLQSDETITDYLSESDTEYTINGSIY